MTAEFSMVEPLIHTTTERLSVYGSFLMRAATGQPQAEHVATVYTESPGIDVVASLFPTAHPKETALYAALRSLILTHRTSRVRLDAGSRLALPVENFVQRAFDARPNLDDNTAANLRNAVEKDSSKLTFPHLNKPDLDELLIASYAAHLLWEEHTKDVNK